MVALRHWRERWLGRWSSVRLRADNMRALAAIAYPKAKGPNVAIIARELALKMSDASFASDVYQHLPGVVSFCADSLSLGNSTP